MADSLFHIEFYYSLGRCDIYDLELGEISLPNLQHTQDVVFLL